MLRHNRRGDFCGVVAGVGVPGAGRRIFSSAVLGYSARQPQVAALGRLGRTRSTQSYLATGASAGGRGPTLDPARGSSGLCESHSAVLSKKYTRSATRTALTEKKSVLLANNGHTAEGGRTSSYLINATGGGAVAGGGNTRL